MLITIIFINGFHKNHPANLINICKECHEKIHKEDKRFKFVLTSVGYQLSEI